MPRENGNLVGMSSAEMHRILDGEQQKIERGVIEPASRDLAVMFATRPRVEPGVIHILGGCYMTGSPNAPVFSTLARAWLMGDVEERLFHALHAGLQPVRP
jgi:hypothetical protein